MSNKTETLDRLIYRAKITGTTVGEQQSHPALFLIAVTNNDTGQIETTTVTTEGWDADEKLKELVSKVTGEKYSHLELPEVIGNYMDDIQQHVVEDNQNNLTRTFTGDQIRFKSEEYGTKKSGAWSWKYLDTNIEIDIRYLKNLYSLDTQIKNTSNLVQDLEKSIEIVEKRLNDMKAVHGEATELLTGLIKEKQKKVLPNEDVKPVTSKSKRNHKPKIAA